MEIGDRLRKIAADRAADAAALQQHCRVAERLDEEMVDADLAELVDQDCGIMKSWRCEQAAQQGGLAAAEEAGEDVDRQGRRGGRHEPLSRTMPAR
jgi:hypothetical protein